LISGIPFYNSDFFRVFFPAYEGAMLPISPPFFLLSANNTMIFRILLYMLDFTTISFNMLRNNKIKTENRKYNRSFSSNIQLSILCFYNNILSKNILYIYIFLCLMTSAILSAITPTIATAAAIHTQTGTL